jgi:hypothetical protein
VSEERDKKEFRFPFSPLAPQCCAQLKEKGLGDEGF